MSDPSLHDVSHFVRSWTGIGSETSIDADTLLEADLGVTGQDGDELLKAAEKVFGVSLSNPDDGYRTTFSLSPNEYLFFFRRVGPARYRRTRQTPVSHP